MVCDALGVEVPRECLSTSERRKADAKARKKPVKDLARGRRLAQNKIAKP